MNGADAVAADRNGNAKEGEVDATCPSFAVGTALRVIHVRTVVVTEFAFLDADGDVLREEEAKQVIRKLDARLFAQSCYNLLQTRGALQRREVESASGAATAQKQTDDNSDQSAPSV